MDYYIDCVSVYDMCFQIMLITTTFQSQQISLSFIIIITRQDHKQSFINAEVP